METFGRAFVSSQYSFIMWLSPFTELQGQTFISIVFDEKYIAGRNYSSPG